jgi:hypothetical protein
VLDEYNAETRTATQKFIVAEKAHFLCISSTRELERLNMHRRGLQKPSDVESSTKRREQNESLGVLFRQLLIKAEKNTHGRFEGHHCHHDIQDR